MYGAKFYYDPSKSVGKTWTVDSTTALYCSLVFGMVLSWIIMLLAVRDIRTWHYYNEKVIAEAEKKLKKMKNGSGGVALNVNGRVSEGKTSSEMEKLTNLISHAHAASIHPAKSFIKRLTSKKVIDENIELQESKVCSSSAPSNFILADLQRLESGADTNRKRQVLGIDSWSQMRPTELVGVREVKVRLE